VADNCRRVGLPRAHAGLLAELGTYYFCHDEPAQALRFYREGLAVADTRLQGEPLLRAGLLKQISATDPHAAGALRVARRALALARSHGSADDAFAAEFYNVVGYVLKMNGAPWRALPYYRRALKIAETESGPDSAAAAEYLNNIGALYEGQGDYARAVEYLTKARDVLERAYGHEHCKFAIALNNLGRAQCRLGAFDSALVNHRRAKAIYRTVFGNENRDLAMSLYFTGVALHGLGRPSEARGEGEAALAILERKYGSADDATRRVRFWIDNIAVGCDSHETVRLPGIITDNAIEQ
jgi:tetratricopeptide (TPR) repeat protein